MKIKKFALLGVAAVLSSCSLGAEVISKDAFKKILEQDVKPTVVNSAFDNPAYYGVSINTRNIAQKTYNQSIYEFEGSAFALFKTIEGRDKGLSVNVSKSIVSSVTKEIINSAGLKTFSDVEKTNVSTSYTLENEVDNAGNHKMTVEKTETTSTIYTDYLEVELDPITGRIATAELLVDDDIYSFNVDKVTYNTFEKEGDTGGEEEEEGEDEGDEGAVISLQDTTWDLIDSTGAFAKSTINIKTDADSIVSKNISVGTIVCNSVIHDLYMFEKTDTTYYFEIRRETETKDISVVSELAYTNNADAYTNQVLPKINEFLAIGVASEVSTAIFGSYVGTYNSMKENLDNGKTVEILSRPAGMVFRVIEGGALSEVLLSKQDEDSKHRQINSVVERQGLDGNIINSIEFTGFNI